MTETGLTFEQFLSTKKWCDDLGAELNDARWEEEAKPAVGYLYMGSLYIEKVQDTWSDSARAKGDWYLLIGNQEWITNDLDSLERQLYEFAVSEGYNLTEAI